MQSRNLIAAMISRMTLSSSSSFSPLSSSSSSYSSPSSSCSPYPRSRARATFSGLGCSSACDFVTSLARSGLNCGYDDDDLRSYSSCLDDLTSTCPALEGTLLKKTKKLLVRSLMMRVTAVMMGSCYVTFVFMSFQPFLWFLCIVSLAFAPFTLRH